MTAEKLLSEGDINISEEREKGHNSIQDETTRQLLEEDSRYFMHG